MKQKDDLYEELNEHGPGLVPFKKHKDGFQPPPGYFDRLENDVFRQLDALGARRTPAAFAPAGARPSWWQFLQSLWQPRVALALGTIVVLAVAAWWYILPQPYGYTGIARTDISAEDAEAFLLNNQHDLDPELIAGVLPPDELPAISLDNPDATVPENNKATNPEIRLDPEDLENLLNEMSDEELKELL